MIPVRTYQDERQLAWGNINIFAKSTIYSREWFRSTDQWVMGQARFLYATLLNKCMDICDH